MQNHGIQSDDSFDNDGVTIFDQCRCFSYWCVMITIRISMKTFFMLLLFHGDNGDNDDDSEDGRYNYKDIENDNDDGGDNGNCGVGDGGQRISVKLVGR